MYGSKPRPHSSSKRIACATRHAPRVTRRSRACLAQTVATGVNDYRSEDNGIVLITHYQRLLDYIKPDFVHIMAKGRIVRSGGPELALELEREGYKFLDNEEAVTGA